MAVTEEFTIELPGDLAAEVRARVAAGEFSTPSQLVQQSLSSFVLGDGRPLAMATEDFDKWLKSEVLPVYEAMHAEPERGKSIHQVRERLAQERIIFEKAR